MFGLISTFNLYMQKTIDIFHTLFIYILCVSFLYKENAHDLHHKDKSFYINLSTVFLHISHPLILHYKLKVYFSFFLIQE